MERRRGDLTLPVDRLEQLTRWDDLAPERTARMAPRGVWANPCLEQLEQVEGLEVEVVEAQPRARITVARLVALVLLAVALLYSVGPVLAQSAGQGVLVVRNDRGGEIVRRQRQIEALRENGTRVELRGETCLSSCTMFLGLPNTCVDPKTTFGFHGPSSYGTPLSAHDFDYWSRLLAGYYPPRLAHWYMTKARYKIADYYRIKGAELVRMGVAACPGDKTAGL